ncbi:FadR/GntR family transcriptional regulator [Epibacterium sp. Ofav1-8]|uniref:FadR/GntR family transcriptional regulator n=1 Tax=Epibacterium sp. Ofav1-8 TaxID=2917735 RepID=UPI001EF640C3|nr:FCD domain-containing protein [Epibacterium sp. Ofav1-8]MCG7624606.1 FCD domain-containing protein [Epibacterium sp. Ofav1-8]
MSKPTRARGQPRRSRPVRVADEIKTWVVERDLQQGDKLPNETEMISLFGVSKGTVREAMRILEAQGLILTRTGPGGGSFVDKVSAERARSLLANYFYFQNLSIADIYQMRRALEPELAASLAGTLSEEQLAEMEALAARYPEPAQSAEEEKEQHIASLDFHARLAEFSGNALLGFVISFMARVLTDMTIYRKLYEPPNHELWRRGREHQMRLVEALRHGNGDEARRIMASHMQGAEDLMTAQEAQLARRFIGE